jgi:hypothetical protein
MSQALVKVQEALEEAHRDSPRSGKWSTVNEVKTFESDTDLTTLRKLVKDGAAKEKLVKGVPTKLFKPTRAGAAAQGLGDKDGDQDRGQDGDGKKPRRGGKHPKKPRRRGKDRDPRKDKKPRRPRKPTRRRGDGKKPTRRTNGEQTPKPKGPRRGSPGETIGAGIGTLLVGGMGGSSGGGALRGGSPGLITGPM